MHNSFTDISDKHLIVKELFLNRIKDELEFSSINLSLLNKIEKEESLPKNYHLIIFPSGISDILASLEFHFADLMIDFLYKQEIQPAKTREKLSLALKTRIMMLMSKQSQINFASTLILPKHITNIPYLTYYITDKIWRYAGDISTDFNHYTKRFLLSSVYIRASLFYIADNSKDHYETSEYIDKMLNDIIKLGGIKKIFGFFKQK